MKLLRLLCLALLLGACGYLPTEDTASPAEGTAEGPIDSPVTSTSDNAPLQLPSENTHADEEVDEQYYLPVADWLVQRKDICQQDHEAIDAQLARYRESFSGAPESEEAPMVVAYSQLKALMLASCRPARTPGLLKNFLDSIRARNHWPPEYAALFDLLHSEYQAYALLEENYRELEARHQKTIDGIGNIEQSLESQADP